MALIAFDSQKKSNIVFRNDCTYYLFSRGKRIKKTPNNVSKYPKKAWFTYADETCTYDCQAIEYLWWGYAAYTGI